MNDQVIDKLDNAIETMLIKLNEISAYIKKVEKVLQKSPVPYNSSIKFQDHYLCYDGDRLLVKKDSGAIVKPLIECNTLLRVNFSIVLEKFVEAYVKHLQDTKPYEPKR